MESNPYSLEEAYQRSLRAATMSVASEAEEQLKLRRERGKSDNLEPIVYSGRKVGRNDPCPCRSGKKFKKCCLIRTRYRRAAPTPPGVTSIGAEARKQ